MCLSLGYTHTHLMDYTQEVSKPANTYIKVLRVNEVSQAHNHYFVRRGESDMLQYFSM